MALPATLYDFDVALEHVDRGLHQRVQLKVARHPSETLPRMWLRVVAYLWAGLVIIESFLTIGQAPWFSFAAMLLAILVIYGISVSVDYGAPDM